MACRRGGPGDDKWPRYSNSGESWEQSPILGPSMQLQRSSACATTVYNMKRSHAGVTLSTAVVVAARKKTSIRMTFTDREWLPAR